MIIFREGVASRASSLAVGFGIPGMPQGTFYVFADASRWTDDSYQFAFELLEKAGVRVAPGVDFGQGG